ncbi:MAG: ribose 5-phosphate isomerase B [Clostridia bacterium]|nr:ribose 5-phosphate isomerase B [Clostridia bacterium]
MLAIGSDHGGFELKEHIKKYLDEQGVKYKDYGIYNEDSADYPDCAEHVCRTVIDGEAERGILVCGTGIGISIAANKFKGIRAALCSDVYSATMARLHNDANIICLGGRVTGREHAFMIIDAWRNAEFLGGRHSRRIEKIHAIEQ